MPFKNLDLDRCTGPPFEIKWKADSTFYTPNINIFTYKMRNKLG